MKSAFVVFLVCAVPVTVLDIYTTELARQRGGFMELHPDGFQPLGKSAFDDAIKILIGLAVVGIAANLKKDGLKNALSSRFYEWDEELFSNRAWAAYLIVIPCFLYLTRWSAVFTNTCNLTIGWSPLQRFTIDPIERLTGSTAIGHMFTILVVLVALWFPASWLIVRALYFVNGGRRFQKEFEGG